jgi:ribonuclease HII
MTADATGLMESRLRDAGFERVAGADEVGRGALAGPLVAAAVILPPEVDLPGLKDSKLCTRLQRERLAARIEEVALAMAIVRVPHARIDKVGLQPANLSALRRAVKELSVEPDFVIFDCFRLKRFPYPSLGVKKGDAVSKNVAAASIVAKVHRDAAMRRYHRRHSRYGFATNMGYGTRAHWNALIAHGPSPVHRLSFFGVVGFPDEDGVVRPHKARDLETKAPSTQEECV